METLRNLLRLICLAVAAAGVTSMPNVSGNGGDDNALVALVPQQSCYYEHFHNRLACVCKNMDMAASLDLRYVQSRVARFFLVPNDHKIYQMATKYTKWPQNIPNGHKIYQMATKYTKWS
jgi:hypothetical protein